MIFFSGDFGAMVVIVRCDEIVIMAKVYHPTACKRQRKVASTDPRDDSELSRMNAAAVP